MMNKSTRILKAKDPADLVRHVNDCVTGNYPEDLHGQIFVSAEGLICQNVVPSPCIDEYRLIVANDLDDLELQEQNLILLGFDFFLSTIMWNGFYLQWMSRMNESGARVRDAIAQVFTPMRRVDELQLVEDVRAGLSIRPVAEDVFQVAVPSPFRLS